MQIIGTDNHDRDSVSDHVLCTGMSNDPECAPGYVQVIQALNQDLGDGEGYYYQLKADDYKPHRWEP